MIDYEKKARVEAQLQAAEMEEAEVRVVFDAKSLADLNLEHELVEQYGKVKQLMDDVLDDFDTPANQKAQVANSVVSALAQLVKLQEDLQREQSLKLMESCLVDAIKMLPTAVKDSFFSEYEKLAKKAGLM